MRIYKVLVFFPAFYPIEANDEAEALEKVGEFYNLCSAMTNLHNRLLF